MWPPSSLLNYNNPQFYSEALKSFLSFSNRSNNIIGINKLHDYFPPITLISIEILVIGNMSATWLIVTIAVLVARHAWFATFSLTATEYTSSCSYFLTAVDCCYLQDLAEDFIYFMEVFSS